MRDPENPCSGVFFIADILGIDDLLQTIDVFLEEGTASQGRRRLLVPASRPGVFDSECRRDVEAFTHWGLNGLIGVHGNLPNINFHKASKHLVQVDGCQIDRLVKCHLATALAPDGVAHEVLLLLAAQLVDFGASRFHPVFTGLRVRTRGEWKPSFTVGSGGRSWLFRILWNGRKLIAARRFHLRAGETIKSWLGATDSVHAATLPNRAQETKFLRSRFGAFSLSRNKFAPWAIR